VGEKARTITYLARIGIDQMHRIAEGNRELDILADQSPQHFFEAGDHAVEADRPGVHHLLAAECQQLSGESGRAFCGVAYLLNILAAGIRRVDVAQQQ